MAWSKITSKPTTLSGYGITDGVSTSTSITLNPTANQTTVSGGTQNLSANRTWTVGTVQDIATTSSPTFHNVTANGNFIGRTFMHDTRSVNAAPSTYSNQIAYEFKSRSTLGAPGAGNYGGLITIAPWGDNSGNNDHQLFFNDGGIFYRKANASGTNATDWGAWSQLVTTDNNPSVPIGSIIAWHKNGAGVPDLPNGWVECNGGTVSDASSPINGMAIPNLNSNADSPFESGTNNGGRYLRGSTTSGTMQSDQIPNFEINQSDTDSGVENGSVYASGTNTNYSDWLNQYYSHDRIRIRYNESQQVRPLSMTVVWIMRVK